MSSIQFGTAPRAFDRAYPGRSRRCHHTFRPARLSSHFHYHRCHPPAGDHRNQPPARVPELRGIASRRKERRFQRLRDIPVAGTVEVLWSKYLWYCKEPACDRLSFFESTPQGPRRARSTGRLREHLVDAVICSGMAVSETAAGSPCTGGRSGPR